MTKETERIIDEMTARAPDGENDRNKLRALLPPENMIDMIANAKASGYPVTW
jgi:hypothetical protein